MADVKLRTPEQAGKCPATPESVNCELSLRQSSCPATGDNFHVHPSSLGIQRNGQHSTSTSAWESLCHWPLIHPIGAADGRLQLRAGLHMGFLHGQG